MLRFNGAPPYGLHAASNTGFTGWWPRRTPLYRGSMRTRGITMIWAVALIAIACGVPRLGAQTPAQSASAAQGASDEHKKTQGLSFDGDVALWTVAIKPDKTADFEQVLAKVRDALEKSANPQRKQQAAGWRVMKIAKPLPNGNIAYVHIISPVVAGADYTILKAIYDEFPSESQQLYALYRDAFAQSLALATGSVVMDMSQPH